MAGQYYVERFPVYQQDALQLINEALHEGRLAEHERLLLLHFLAHLRAYCAASMLVVALHSFQPVNFDPHSTPHGPLRARASWRRSTHLPALDVLLIAHPNRIVQYLLTVRAKSESRRLRGEQSERTAHLERAGGRDVSE